MGLGLGAIKKNYQEPQDTAPEPEAAPAIPQAAVTEALADAAVEVPTQAQSPVKDDFDAIGDIITEKAAPTINDVTAPVTGVETPAVVAPVTGEVKEELKPEEDEAAQIAEFAKANGLTEEEAAQLINAEKARRAAISSGMAPQDARRVSEDADQRRAIMDAARGQGGGGSPGAVASIVGGIGALIKGGAGMVGSVGNKVGGRFRAAQVDNSPEAVRDRLFGTWKDSYENSLSGYARAGEDLKARMGEFNAAFLNSESASRLRKMASDGGQDLDAFMTDLREGRGSDAAKDLARRALGEPKVAKAWDAVTEAEGRAAENAKGIEAGFGKLNRNFAERLDAGIEAERITEVNDKVSDGLKKPVFEGPKKTDGADPAHGDEETKKFMERMKEIVEQVRRIVERIAQKLGIVKPS